uniref:Uncharacterized protein n=1 Tax=Geobacillus sp. (strain WCH70) TaxID=471223 RepID=C5D8B5_GEOSW
MGLSSCFDRRYHKKLEKVAKKVMALEESQVQIIV